MPLQQGIQVVLQQPLKSGGRTCRAFTGLPHIAPAWFCVEPLSAADASMASQLGDELAHRLISLSQNAREVTPPCGGSSYGSCHAESVTDCAKVLLPVVGATGGNSKILHGWPVGDPLARVCPVFLPGANLGGMPLGLKALNGAQWSPGDSSAIGKILQLGGLVSSRLRLFISYVRADTQALAEQLHDHLVRLGFEVFLDRFSVGPGVDFQVRLTEELSRMGTVLVLESPGILKSRWVQHEVNFARSYRLGLVGLHLPKGRLVPGIAHDSRLPVSAAQLGKRGQLTQKHLKEIGLKLQIMHAAAERRRIAYLRDAMSDALLVNGFTHQGFDADGVIIARKSNEYAFAVRNLPPEVADFQAVEGHRAPPRRAFVVAPAKHMDWRVQRPLAWLSRVTNIEIEDEGDMVALVRGLT